MRINVRGSYSGLIQKGDIEIIEKVQKRAIKLIILKAFTM